MDKETGKKLQELAEAQAAKRKPGRRSVRRPVRVKVQ